MWNSINRATEGQRERFLNYTFHHWILEINSREWFHFKNINVSECHFFFKNIFIFFIWHVFIPRMHVHTRPRYMIFSGGIKWEIANAIKRTSILISLNNSTSYNVNVRAELKPYKSKLLFRLGGFWDIIDFR